MADICICDLCLKINDFYEDAVYQFGGYDLCDFHYHMIEGVIEHPND